MIDLLLEFEERIDIPCSFPKLLMWSVRNFTISSFHVMNK